ncbi:hypothetical protein BDM02DRAFT_3112857, partial [Thelephora ganbajun]
MDLSDFKNVTIPQREHPRLEKLAKTCESCRPMDMFRSNKDQLRYDEFGLYVDKHGDPSRSIGTVERVAWHPPYTLFGSRFIEIRRVETGRLVQITSRKGMRCIWEGQGTNHPQAVSESWDEIVSEEPRVGTWRVITRLRSFTFDGWRNGTLSSYLHLRFPC